MAAKKQTQQSGKKRKQQSVAKRVQEPAPTRTKATRTAAPKANVKRDNPRVSQPNPRRVQPQSRAYTIFVGTIFVALGACLFLLLFTFSAADLAPDADRAMNLFGVVGAYVANIMLTLFGLAAFLFSALSLLLGICTISGRQFEVHPSEFVGLCILLLGGAPLLHVAFDGAKVLDHQAGGVFGQWLAEFELAHMPRWGFYTTGVALSIFGGLLVTDTRLKSFFLGIWRILRWTGRTVGGALAEPFRKAPSEPAPAEDTVAEAAPEPAPVAAKDDSESLYYEDSPSQLLDGEALSLEEREAMAKAEIPEEPQTETPSEEAEAAVAIPEPAVEELAEDSEDAVEEPSTPDAAEPSPENDQKALSDLMARIRRSSPKSRSIKRSHSVPAIEPEFDFESILSPEQISNNEFPQHDSEEDVSAQSREAEEIAPRTSVLGNWKPRSIGRRAMPVSEPSVDATVALTGADHEIAQKVLSIPAPEAPPHLTKDLLAQLTTEEIEVENSTRVAGIAVDAFAPTTDCPRPRSIRQDDAISPELRALMDEYGFGNKVALSKSNSAPIMRDGKKTSCAPASATPTRQNAAVATDSARRAPVTRCAAANATSDINDAFDKSDTNNTPNSGDAKDIINALHTQGTNNTNDAFDPFENGVFEGNGKKKNIASNKNNATSVKDIKSDNVNENVKTDESDNDDATNCRFATVANRMNDSAQPTLVRDNPLQPLRGEKPRNSATTQVPSLSVTGGFVVTEGKKRVSEAELLQAEQARNKMLAQDVEYHRPPLSLLHYDPSTQKGFDHEALRRYADKIEQKLAEYHIQGQVVQICPGPIITRFEFQPAPGTKVARIQSLSDDLMMALEIAAIRILAPIPGKGVVGIEIPNEKRNTIYLKEIIGSKQFMEAKSILTIALGKDSEGEPVVSDLAKMPHLLVAGSTGSGKSVAINTMLCSLLYNATPDEVKLILVDPKCLELSIYEGIPHLLVPPITTPKETAAALDWACDEMDDRYRKLAAFGVRNIAGYNEQLKNPTLPKSIEAVRQLDDDGEPKYKPMPYIVIVVDEFADLMMTAGKEIETSIARLAQKARAAGIHIILATQRPSTNVITGVIKANFPTRIAFRVFSYVDSRTILDQKGAESLLGMGDSLFLPPNTGVLQRVHGAYVSDEEVQSIVSFLSSQRRPEYNLDITTPKDDDGSEDAMPSLGSSDLDPLYDQAVQIVAETRQASASFLQRKLSIGFNRAARIVEQMEREGVVGPQRGQKPREVLIAPI